MMMSAETRSEDRSGDGLAIDRVDPRDAEDAAFGGQYARDAPSTLSVHEKTCALRAVLLGDLLGLALLCGAAAVSFGPAFA